MLDLFKFGQVLRLRWSWYESKEPAKIWVGMGNPYKETGLDLFYASTVITSNNGLELRFGSPIGSVAVGLRTLPRSFMRP